ncbi:Predicted amidohydrolase [Desulfocicer vacuolatum DSM 3385]|uniref:Predicted amidohydrolase n=1 Tax=Desulfocicer vacuolatum DSM 3385 TaxID=1121400 RepID=A0A1W2E6J9_9BACT|nr:nitrilase-related carbon-nitrogen hydrolase [Desulfocicer vacuolatum]SMD05265.1 Predicted amidohydrolase [Desulfocicer vacuolatum DSM 3385]
MKPWIFVSLVFVFTLSLFGCYSPKVHAFEMERFRIALVQMDATRGKENNLKKIEHFATRASRNKAQIICFPELSITGYERTHSLALAEAVPGKSSGTVSKLSQRLGIIILAGLIEKVRDELYITHMVAFTDGRVEIYRKTHPGSNERVVFSQGNALPVFHAEDTRGNGVTFAIGICYDMHFPEIAAVYSLKGAQILFAPHASPLGGERRIAVWNRYLGARAYDNTLYVAACNHLGRNGTKTYGSGMGIWDPGTAQLLTSFVDGEDGILFYDLNLAALAKKRGKKSKRFFLKDRREELY